MPRKFPGHFTACGASGGVCVVFQTLSGLPAYEGPCGLKACRRSLCALLSVSAQNFLTAPSCLAKSVVPFRDLKIAVAGHPVSAFSAMIPAKSSQRNALAALALPGSGAVQALLKAVSLFCGHRRTAWRHPQKGGALVFSISFIRSYTSCLMACPLGFAFGGLP